jgi:hypothetical protein
MRTGEGKTLVAVLPAFLNALSGKSVHVVTVNDYLARRDCEWVGQVHRFLGLKVSPRCLTSFLLCYIITFCAAWPLQTFAHRTRFDSVLMWAKGILGRPGLSECAIPGPAHARLQPPDVVLLLCHIGKEMCLRVQACPSKLWFLGKPEGSPAASSMECRRASLLFGPHNLCLLWNQTWLPLIFWIHITLVR